MSDKISPEELKQIVALPLKTYVELAIADKVPPAIPFGNQKEVEELHWVYVLSPFLAGCVEDIVAKVEEFQVKHPRSQFQMKIEVAKK